MGSAGAHTCSSRKASKERPPTPFIRVVLASEECRGDALAIELSRRVVGNLRLLTIKLLGLRLTANF